MQILLLAADWPMMAGEFSPAQRRELSELLPTIVSQLWSFGFAGASTTYLTMRQYLAQNEAAIAFFAIFLISLGLCLNVFENSSVGLSAASVKFFKVDLRMPNLASGCVIVGLLLLLVLFSRLVWVHALGHLIL